MTNTSQSFFKQIIHLFIGKGGQFEPEHRFLNFLYLYYTLLTLSSLPELISIHLMKQFYTNLVLTVLTGILYYFSRIKARVKYLSTIYALLAYLSIGICWFFSGGINGISPFYSIALMIVFLFLFQGNWKFILSFLMIFEVLVLVIIEYNYPHLITGYNSQHDRYLDLFLSLITAGIYVMAIVYYAKLLYQKEKQNTIARIEEYRKNSQYLKGKLSEKIKVLSLRERDVFKLIIEGRSNKEISDELNVSVGTIKSHINSIYKKLSIKTRSELINERNNHTFYHTDY